MEYFRTFRKVGTVCHIEFQLRRYGNRGVFPDAVYIHVLFIKVHKDRNIVGLSHPVLESCGDRQFIPFRRQHQIGKMRRRDGKFVELEKSAHGGGDDGTGTRQSQTVGNGAAVAHGKVPLCRGDALFFAVAVEAVDRGFHETDPAVISVDADIFTQSVHIFEHTAVPAGRQKLQFRRFVKGHFCTVVAENKRYGLAVIAV